MPIAHHDAILGTPRLGFFTEPVDEVEVVLIRYWAVAVATEVNVCKGYDLGEELIHALF
jgi:hypothetical protein